MQKRYNLTQIGDKSQQRIYYRRDAHCPIVTHVRRRGQEGRARITAWLINISEESCLITADEFPSGLADIYIIFPGLGSKVFAHVKSQGDFTVEAVFDRQLPAGLVSQISRLTATKPTAPIA